MVKIITPTIGIDLIEIERFKNWHNYSDKQLQKVFSTEEITYCRAIPIKTAERFAVRFAAKEALFKALAPYTQIAPPLFALFASAELKTDQQGTHMHVAWNALRKYYPTLNMSNITIQTSLSHTNTTACAVVMTHCFI